MFPEDSSTRRSTGEWQMPKISGALLNIGIATTYRDFSMAAVDLFRETLEFNAAEVRIRIFDKSRDEAEHVHSLFPTKRNRSVDELAARKQMAPWFEFIERNPQTTVYRGQDHTLPDRARLERLPFFKEFMVKEGWHDNMGMSFYDQSGPHSWIFINRSFDQPAFTEAELGFFRQIYPFFEATLQRIHLLTDSEDTRAHLETSLLDLPIATMILDWKMNLQHANRAAHRMCDFWLYGSDKCFLLKSSRRAEVPSEIVTACRELADLWSASPQARPADFQRVVPHPSDPGLRATVSVLRPNTTRLGTPSFLIRINQAADRSAAGSEAAVEQVFARLTPAERVVASLVAAGHSNKVIAQKLGKSIMTVKNQVHHVLDKVGASSRTHLAALMR